MNSDLPKVLHPLAGAPLLVHAMKSGETLDPDRTVIVAGHGAEQVQAAALNWNPDAQIVVQDEQLGTGHAVAQAKNTLTGFEGNALVLYGDTPFMTEATLQAMIAARATHDIVMLGFEPDDPLRYGRMVMDGDDLNAIVEFKDADDATRKITLCNGGVVCADAQTLFGLLDQIGNDNAAGEYYLTDIVALARSQDLTATVVRCDPVETMGIDTRAQLVRAEAIIQGNMRTALLDDGVAMPAPDTVYLSHDTVIGRDAIVEPNVVFASGVTVESGATIRAFSHLEGCHVARGAVVGPYARLRPGAELSEHVKIGNFVEVKNAQIAEGAKVNHLSYIGDASIGRGSNVGAGTVTCNYDGFLKHTTTIGNDVFVGSNTMLVAPVVLGDGSMTASGSVINRDVPAGDMAIARSRQENKTGFAQRLREKLRAIKAKKGA